MQNYANPCLKNRQISLLFAGFFVAKIQHKIAQKTVDDRPKKRYNNTQTAKRVKMQYTLITKTGKVMQFYIKAVADMYQQGLGGVVITQQLLETQENGCSLSQSAV